MYVSGNINHTITAELIWKKIVIDIFHDLNLHIGYFISGYDARETACESY